MSGAFEKRQKGFESKWAHDEELRFKVFARRNKLLGVWAAAELGLKGDAAEAYGKEVVAADFQKAGDEDVFEKVRDDFKAKGIAISDHMLRVKMEELIQTAKSYRDPRQQIDTVLPRPLGDIPGIVTEVRRREEDQQQSQTPVEETVTPTPANER